MPECRCGAYVQSTQRYCNLCGREVNPGGQLTLVSEQPRPRNKGTSRDVSVGSGDDRTPIWEIYGAPDNEKARSAPLEPVKEPLIVLDTSKKNKRGKVKSPAVSHVMRRIELQSRPGGMAVFWLAAPGGLSVESRPFPKSGASREPGTAVVDRAFREFLSVLRRHGWKEVGKGSRWYEIELTRQQRR